MSAENLPESFELWTIDKIRMVWDFVEAHLKRVIAKGDVEWIPPDIYVEIANKQAFLFAFNRNGKTEGITIVRKDVDRITGEPYILSYVSSFEVWDDDVAEKVIAFYDDIAKAAGCKKIKFVTSREGWSHKKHGCRLTTFVFEREVTNV